MKIKLSLLFLFTCYFVKAQNWEPLGPDDFKQASYNKAQYLDMALGNGTPYLIYQENTNGSTYVKQFKNGNWEVVGGESSFGNDFSIVVDESTPYVVYKNNNLKASVKKFNGISWEIVGIESFSAGEIFNPKIVFSAGVFYVSYIDVSKNNKATVQKFNGNSWELVGLAGFSAGYSKDLSIAVNGSIPYVIYRDEANSNKATVKKFDGTNWETVGTIGFSSGSVNSTFIVFNGVTPYVVYSDGTKNLKSTVQKFNGNSWELVGPPGFSDHQADYTTISFSGSTPYISYTDIYVNAPKHKIVVQKFNGVSWEIVGSRDLNVSGGNSKTSIVFYDKTPYIFYNDSKAIVQKIDGDTWELLGSKSISEGPTHDISVTINSGVPYILYSDDANGGKATVQKYDGTKWNPLGKVGFSADGISYNSIVFNGDIPYVAYRDANSNYKATVQKFNGLSWELVGPAGFSQTSVAQIPLVFYNNTAYVAYAGSGLKATVQKFNGTSWELVGIAGFSAGQISDISIAFIGSTPYVAYRDATQFSKITVQKFNGLVWEIVGNAGFSETLFYNLSILSDGNTPYVYYGGSNGINIQKFNGVSWVNVGNSGFAYQGTFGDMTFVGSTPFVVYTDGSTKYNKLSVQKFNGTKWEPVGNLGFTAGETLQPRISTYGNKLVVAYSSNGAFAKSFLITTLPVTLTSFNATTQNQKQVNLTWQTASESNNDYFTVAKSEDGKTFTKLLTVKTKGEQGAAYETIDFNPFAGTSYYKLSQTDLDGKTEELGIRTIKLESLKEESLSVYPNPVKDGLLYIKNPNLKGLQSLSIYDLTGKEVIIDKVNFNGEIISYRISEKLAKGTYLLQIGESQNSIKIVIE